jgi:ketosteroid isomerase-like protein
MEKMKLTLICFALMALSAVQGQTNTRQDDDQMRIRSLENAWNQATLQKDAKALQPLLAEELIYIDYDGTIMNKAEYLASMRTPGLHFEQVVSEYSEIKVFGQGAMAIGEYREKGIKKGKPYLRRERFVDTWIKRNGLWLCVASQSTLIAH